MVEQLVKIHDSKLVECEGLDMLCHQTPPLYVISMIGDSRTGKSTFLNLLINHALDEGTPETSSAPKDYFSVGHAMDPNTMGAWVQAHPMPAKQGTLVVVDVEGSGQGNPKGLDRLYTLVCMISSELIINIEKKLDEKTLTSLQRLTAVSQKVQKGTQSHFPHLSVVVQEALETQGQDKLKQWLDCSRENRDPGNDETRMAINHLFSGHPGLHCVARPEKATVETWKAKDNIAIGELKQADPEYCRSLIQAFSCIMRSLQPKMSTQISAQEPEHLNGKELVSATRKVIERVNKERAFDVDADFHAVKFIELLKDFQVDLQEAFSQELPKSLSDVTPDQFMSRLRQTFSKVYEKSSLSTMALTPQQRHEHIDASIDGICACVERAMRDNPKKSWWMKLRPAVFCPGVEPNPRNSRSEFSNWASQI